MKKTIYYSSFDEDIVRSANQNYKLPEDYVWIASGRADRWKSRVIYGIAVAFAFCYGKLVWRIRVVGRKKLREAGKRGYFIYGNHTQPFGDVFLPAYTNLGKRIYTIVSPSNYGIPVIGKILPALGALPIPDDFGQMKKFFAAIRQRIGEGHAVVIFPEAHVWPYYTGIRPFGPAAFYYPVTLSAPVYSMTTTYRRSPILGKPRITVTIDGPFFPDESLSRKAREKKLCEEVTAAMTARASEDNVEFVHYEKKQEEQAR